MGEVRDRIVDWRRRADAARTTANEMSDARARQTMLDVASVYTKVAEQAEQRFWPPPAAPAIANAGQTMGSREDNLWARTVQQRRKGDHSRSM